MLKRFIPPVFRIRRKPGIPSPKIYRTFEEALADCREGGYEQSELARVVVEKNIIFKENLSNRNELDLPALRTLIGVGLADSGDDLRVMDFGGGGGYHYTIARKAFGNSKTIKWNVVETEAMSQAAKRISDDNLRFFTTIEAAKNDLGAVDLVFSSSAIQYCPEPLKYLDRLTRIESKFIFITRTPFIAGNTEIIAKQNSNLSDNGPGPLPHGFTDRIISYPITYSSMPVVEKILNERYEIRFKIVEDKAAYRVGDKEIGMFGYFGVLKP